MFKKGSQLFIVSLLLLLVVNCAKRGTPTGGPKDETPPVLVSADPPNYSTNFEGDEIRIYFDEFIKLKDLNKNLIVSPPMDPKASITPMGSASRFIDIKIMDTLIENTTYVFNFGESVTDNNEGNPFSFFKYVFSTGDYIDSLKVVGVIRDALFQKADNYVTVMLYEADSTYTDSVVYKKVPRYVTNTLDSSNVFEITNVKAGRYRLAALKDADNNYTFQPAKDKIAFYDSFIEVPTDSVYVLNLFNEELAPEVSRPKQAAAQRIAFPYKGNSDSINVELISARPEGFKSLITRKKDQDSLQYWFTPKVQTDSLIFKTLTSKKTDTAYMRLRNLKPDSLQINPVSTGLVLEEDFILNSTIPVVAVDTTKISIQRKDSTFVSDFKVEVFPKKLQLSLKFLTEEKESYAITMLPEALTDFYGSKNDTLRFRATTKEYSDYGEFDITLKGAAEVQHIVQLVTEKGDVKREQIGAVGQVEFKFDRIEPGKYFARIIVDLNANGKFDTGNFLEQRQPEEVLYYPKELDIRSGWYPKETFILNQE
ncbi:Ig-like domain-containing protein [Leeuwenhoekiella sp. W20_SRS_FM14]|uniref:Ig-like domain-containing protein n=1 Tax=Leeuwenhoekiella sp. W20_SRS_FM14 TaxID=3240270 RepID=UPI003F9B5147